MFKSEWNTSSNKDLKRRYIWTHYSSKCIKGSSFFPANFITEKRAVTSIKIGTI